MAALIRASPTRPRAPSQVTRLAAELDQVRLDRANLRAAMRATLAAHADGEADPLWYLRDELNAAQARAEGSRRPSVTTYRKMRRQARLARRSGLQPMMVINAGESFPETLGVVLLARWAWRYRSELAPGRGGRCPGGGRLVAAPHPAALVARSAVLTGVATWAVALFGAHWRLPTLAERVYAAVTIYVGGIWLCSATAIGPFFRPLLQALDHWRAYLVGAMVGASAPARESTRLNASCKPGPISPRP